MAEPELEPVRVGGYIVAYRPKSTAKKAAKKQATSSAAKKDDGSK